jgi:tetratricopeptide (TPR) repeat protein
VILLKEELSIKNQQIDFLLTQLALGQPPPVSERARQLAAQIPETADPYARALKAIAEGRFNEARHLLDEVIAAREVELSSAYHARGEAEFYAGRYAEAATWYKKVLALRPDDPDAMIDAAVSLRIAGEYSEVEPLYQKALEIQKRTLGPDHAAVGISLDNLAALYRAQGRLDEAEPLAVQALRMLEKALGPDHPDVAISCNNLASLYQAQGRLEEAGPLFLRAVSIQEKVHGPEHTEVATALNNLGVLRQARVSSTRQNHFTGGRSRLTSDRFHPTIPTSVSASTTWRRSITFAAISAGPSHCTNGRSQSARKRSGQTTRRSPSP